MGIAYQTKYKSNLGHKAIYNCVISYLIVFMMTGPEILDDLENKQINLWPECNPIVLDRMIINV